MTYWRMWHRRWTQFDRKAPPCGYLSAHEGKQPLRRDAEPADSGSAKGGQNLLVFGRWFRIVLQPRMGVERR